MYTHSSCVLLERTSYLIVTMLIFSFSLYCSVTGTTQNVWTFIATIEPSQVALCNWHMAKRRERKTRVMVAAGEIRCTRTIVWYFFYRLLADWQSTSSCHRQMIRPFKSHRGLSLKANNKYWPKGGRAANRGVDEAVCCDDPSDQVSKRPPLPSRFYT